MGLTCASVFLGVTDDQTCSAAGKGLRSGQRTPFRAQEGRGEAAEGAGRGRWATNLLSSRGEHMAGLRCHVALRRMPGAAGRWREQVTQPGDRGSWSIPAVPSHPTHRFSGIEQVHLLFLLFFFFLIKIAQASTPKATY